MFHNMWFCNMPIYNAFLLTSVYFLYLSMNVASSKKTAKKEDKRESLPFLWLLWRQKRISGKWYVCVGWKKLRISWRGVYYRVHCELSFENSGLIKINLSARSNNKMLTHHYHHLYSLKTCTFLSVSVLCHFISHLSSFFCT